MSYAKRYLLMRKKKKKKKIKKYRMSKLSVYRSCSNNWLKMMQS